MTNRRLSSIQFTKSADGLMTKVMLVRKVCLFSLCSRSTYSLSTCSLSAVSLSCSLSAYSLSTSTSFTAYRLMMFARKMNSDPANAVQVRWVLYCLISLFEKKLFHSV